MSKPKSTGSKRVSSQITEVPNAEDINVATEPLARSRRKREDGSRLPISLIEKNTAGAQAIESIKKLIVSGILKPGEALPAERDLAAMLGISRPTLREAIGALCAMNVLDSRHGDGTFVTSLEPALLLEPINFLLRVDEKAILHLFEVRRVLEVGAARIAAPRITEEEIAALVHLVESAYKSLDQPTRYLQYDYDIHTAIIKSTGNPLYISLYESISQLSLKSRQRTASVAATRERAHEDHVAIVEALRSHDGERTARVMQAHLEIVERSFRSNFLGEG